MVVVFGFAFTAWLLCSASAENLSELDPGIFNEILVIITWSLSKKTGNVPCFSIKQISSLRGKASSKHRKVFIPYGYEVTRIFSLALGQPCCFSAAFARTQLIWLCHSQLVIFLFFEGSITCFSVVTLITQCRNHQGKLLHILGSRSNEQCFLGQR